MKSKLFIIAAVLGMGLFAFTEQIVAQQDFQERKTPFGQENEKRIIRALIRPHLNGHGGCGVILGLLSDPNFRNELGMSDVQYERFQKTADEFRRPQTNPELRKIYDEIRAIEAANGRTLQNANEETWKKYFALKEREATMTTYTSTDGRTAENIAYGLEVTLTPEQKQKIKEVQLVAALSDVSLFPSSMFEALDLTDAQKQAMEKIKKELEPEFEKHIEDLATRNMVVQNKIYDEFEKKGIDRSEGLGKLDESMRKQIMEDLNKIGGETEAHGKRFAAQFKAQMFDVLTDEQWLRLQNMIDNPTGLVKMMLDKMKAGQEKKEVWTPGPNSWRPGDPIPEEYRQQRNERRRQFPRGEE